jgi:5-enolpyruvylshikimate-3-phosphate synthase
VLLLAALAEGETTITNLLDSDDTRVMLDALGKLGVKLKRDGDECVVMGTRGAFTAKTADLFLGNAGTAVRPLTAALAVNGGDYRVHGVPRMHERPIGDLVDGLRSGAEVQPTRGAPRLCTWKQAAKILAGFTDGQAAEGHTAGDATLAGLRIAKEQGWTPDGAAAGGQQ